MARIQIRVRVMARIQIRVRVMARIQIRVRVRIGARVILRIRVKMQIGPGLISLGLGLDLELGPVITTSDWNWDPD